MAMLARTASATRPSPTTTCSPVRKSVAVHSSRCDASAKVRSPNAVRSAARSGRSSRIPHRSPKPKSLGNAARQSARRSGRLVASRVNSRTAICSHSSAEWPSASPAANTAPPLQPTSRSGVIPSRASTRHRPRAAAHFTLPDPTTMARRGARAAGVVGDTGAAGSGRAGAHAAQLATAAGTSG
jgi:hypothetical protein